MLKEILLATSLISLFTVADAQRVMTKAEFIQFNRINMYYSGVGLPYTPLDPEWDKTELSRRRREVLERTCLKGKYNLKEDPEYVSPLWADSLLEIYSWSPLPPRKNEILELYGLD